MLKTKIMGSVLFGLIATLALVASHASAAAYKSEVASPSKTFFTSVNEGNFVLKAGATVQCTGATGEGSFVSGATSVTEENVAFSGCTVAGQNATVNMNGCTFKHGEPTGTASPFTIKTITIQCPTEKSIVIKATTAGCTITVHAQTTTGTSTLTNGAQTITITWSITNITYTGSGGICGPNGTTGTATKKSKWQGFKDAVHSIITKIFGG